MPAPAFSAVETLNAFVRCPSKSIFAMLIPAQVRLLAEEERSRMGASTKRGPRSEFSNVKRVVLGGDICTRDVLNQARSLFPCSKVSTGHGMTEASGAIGLLGNSIDEMPIHRGLVAIGKPAGGSSVRIVQPDDEGSSGGEHVVLPRNEPGDLHIGGPCVILRYLNDVQPEVFYHDRIGNWLVTGDRAVMDDDGFVFILGRTKDIVKKMGLSLSPAVAEAVMRRQNGVEVCFSLATHMAGQFADKYRLHSNRLPWCSGFPTMNMVKYQWPLSRPLRVALILEASKKPWRMRWVKTTLFMESSSFMSSGWMTGR